MNVKEFKIHVMRGLMRPEYFYIPLIYKSKESLPVRFRIIDEFGDDVFISKLVLYYQIYSFNHDINQYDTYAKGYTFNADADWRYPVPDPSGYEVPIPDFTNINVKVKNGIAEKSGTTITVTFEIPPIFCIAIFLFRGLNHFSSAKHTKGAPFPPFAISAVLKLPTTSHLVFWEITEISPICSVLLSLIFSLIVSNG